MEFQRPDRRTLTIAAIVVGVAVVLAVAIVAPLYAFGFIGGGGGAVSVPTLDGLEVPTARSRLLEVGLELERGDTRFSPDVPAGSVIDQTPAPGARVARGSTVVVSVSAGSERFAMPDVTGLRLTAATESLKARGLGVDVQTVQSQLASGTVVGSTPAPGAEVTTGDKITLKVSGGSSGGDLLVPYQLTGKTIVIDATPAGGSPDITLDVGRRLQALFEASGARVIMTRTGAEPGLSVATRIQRARISGAAAFVGLSAPATGRGGLTVGTPPSEGTPPSVYLSGVEMAKATLAALDAASVPATAAVAPPDPVRTATGAPGLALGLGAFAVPADARSFSDPSWADRVARSVYRGVGGTLAPRPQQHP
jgi:N-acetylmuramoyl-L-alanine amidase